MGPGSAPPGTAAAGTITRSQYARAFGACATTYERARSDYPPNLIRDVWSFANEAAVEFILEVGAGSGKATVPIAEMGARMDCIEPSRRMAHILRIKTSAFPNVRVWTTSFERWRPHRRYCLLIAAQSWHLIDPGIRLVKAARVLRPGGTLALFWNQPPQPISETARHVLDSVLGKSGLTLTWPPYSSAATGHPACQPGSVPPLYASADFEVAEPKTYWTTYRLTLTSYLDVLHTYPEYRALGASEQQRLDDRIGNGVFPEGDLDMGHRTTLQLATRTETT